MRLLNSIAACILLIPILVSILVLLDAPLEFGRWAGKPKVNLLFQSLFYWMRLLNEVPQAGMAVPLSCFNPCFIGCASWIVDIQAQSLQVQGFNPCFIGCASWISCSCCPNAIYYMFQSLFYWMRLLNIERAGRTAYQSQEFQSLFYWMRLLNTTRCLVTLKHSLFQSLFYWMRLLNFIIAKFVYGKTRVSILVLLDAPLEFCLSLSILCAKSVSILVLLDAPLEYGQN